MGTVIKNTIEKEAGLQLQLAKFRGCFPVQIPTDTIVLKLSYTSATFSVCADT